MNNRTKKMTSVALTISFALILSFVESKIPAFVAIPGVKVGLANIAVIFTLYKFGLKEAVTVSIIRIVIVSMLFGSAVSLMYSAAGAILSLTSMVLLKKLTPLGEIAVSVCGGVMHNVGQILMAMLLLSTAELGYYLIVLAVTGTISGIFIGLCGGFALKRITIKKN